MKQDLVKMLKNYLAEREGKELLLSNYGFMIYEIASDHIYVQDVYIDSDKRQNREASKLVDQVCEIAKQNSISRILTTSDLRAKNAGLGMRAILGYGFEPISCSDNVIYYEKRIKV